MNELLEKLNSLWNSSDDERFKGENPACIDVLEEIEEKFQNMDDEEIKEILENLSGEQLEQLFSVFEDMVDDKPFLKKFMQ